MVQLKGERFGRRRRSIERTTDGPLRRDNDRLTDRPLLGEQTILNGMLAANPENGGNEAMRTYETLELSLIDRVLTIKMKPQADGTNIHWDLANLLEELRGDQETHVVVLTGSGESFLTARPREHYRQPTTFQARTSPDDLWQTFTGIIRIHESLVGLEKPVIAKVNGSVSGLGISLMLGPT